MILRNSFARKNRNTVTAHLATIKTINKLLNLKVMLKKLHLKLALLLTAMVMGAGNVWGTDITISFGTGTGCWAAHTDESFTDSDSRTWTRSYSAGGKSSGQTGYSQFGNSSNTCTSLELKATAGSDITVTAFSVKMSGASATTAGTIYLYKESSGGSKTQLATASVSGTTATECKITSSQVFSSTDILSVSYVGTAKAIKVNELSYSYTNSSSGSNPSVVVASTSVNATAAETDGTINVTYNNITDGTAGVFYCESDGMTQTTYDWIEAEIDASKKLYYVIGANTGAERTAYLKVYALDEEENKVYSDLITITQAAYVNPAELYKYSLFSGDLVEGDYIIYYDGKAMNTTVASDRLKYEEVTPEENIITTNNPAIVWHIAPSGDYWTIYNAEADAYAASTGAKNKAQILANGSDDKALWTVSGTSVYDFVNKANTANSVNATLRNNETYGFACYATGTGGALSLYKKMEETVTISAAGYATFCSDNALNFSGVSGLTAYTATFSENTNTVSFNLVDDVPAKTGVLLKGDPGTYTIPAVLSSDWNVSGNALVGVTSVTTIGKTTKDNSNNVNYNYVLQNGSDGVGFYQVNNDEYKVRANSAYLVISYNAASTDAKLFIGLDGETAVEAVAAEVLPTGTAYNLQGQRVGNDYKGVVIVNGKKVIR